MVCRETPRTITTHAQASEINAVFIDGIVLLDVLDQLHQKFLLARLCPTFLHRALGRSDDVRKTFASVGQAGRSPFFYQTERSTAFTASVEEKHKRPLATVLFEIFGQVEQERNGFVADFQFLFDLFASSGF